MSGSSQIAGVAAILLCLDIERELWPLVWSNLAPTLAPNDPLIALEQVEAAVAIARRQRAELDGPGPTA